MKNTIELELSKIFTFFSGYDPSLQLPFPTSREEYLAGKELFEKIRGNNYRAYNLLKEKQGSVPVETVLEKAGKRELLTPFLMFPIGLGCVVLIIILWIMFPSGLWTFPFAYFFFGLITFSEGAQTPGYMMARRYKEARMLEGIDYEEFNPFNKPENEHLRIIYEDEKQEHEEADEESREIIILQLGFLLLRIAAFGVMGLINTIRNR